MGKSYSEIPKALQEFIAKQQLFFVATAPLSSQGRVNLSPKGYQDSFCILDAQRVAYLDYTGSGAETIAHLRENGRVTLMFAAFQGPANIVRLYGQGRVIEPHHGAFDSLARNFEIPVGLRAIIDVQVDRVSEACGYGVPFYEFQGERRKLVEGWEKRGSDGVRAYQEKKNRHSIDGLPALELGKKSSTTEEST